MQKVIRRAALARNQSKRKAKAIASKEAHDELKQIIHERTQKNRSLIEETNAEKQARREDWMRGPLAPKRDAGKRAGVFGTIHPNRMHPPKIPKEKRRKYLNIVRGDRVCVMKGKEKGKIGTVVASNAETEHVTIDGFNMYDIEFPEFAIKNEEDKRPYRSIALPIPIDDVRLVVPLNDPETGQVKDYIVNHTYGAGPFLDPEYNSETPRHTRYISGQDIEIPWPEIPPDQAQDEECDTLRIDVETKTFTPSLQEAPFPLSVIDELRNPYSKFRQRHDMEWVEEKRREDYKLEWQKSRRLLTPKSEFMEIQHEKKKEAREVDENGDPKVSRKTAAFINEFMARQAKAKKNANV
ncbi:hypothetical protein FQN54_009552 [Arachnomyces sp. PD_36]|nr:hypothetical protein FQN54_009552 [Arachnomyces sp. PD_36]